MALLHSFEFGAAIDGFTAAAAADPSCGIAHWGIALSRWGNPFAAGIKPAPALPGGRHCRGQRRVGAKTDRERAFIAAADGSLRISRPVDQRTRVLAYRDAMEQVSRENPRRHRGVGLLRARHRLVAIRPTRPTRACSQAEDLEDLAPTQPDHPGFAHYIIHAYDVPPLASRALDAARATRRSPLGAARAAHAVAHVHARGLLAGVDRYEHRVGGGGAAQGELAGRGAARDGLPDLRLPADRAGRLGEKVLDALATCGALRAQGHGAGRAGRRRVRVGASPRATRSSAAPGPRPPRWSRSQHVRRASRRSRWFAKRLGAARMAENPARRAGDSMLGRLRARARTAKKPTGRSRSRFSASARRRGWRSRMAARTRACR